MQDAATSTTSTLRYYPNPTRYIQDRSNFLINQKAERKYQKSNAFLKQGLNDRKRTNLHRCRKSRRGGNDGGNPNGASNQTIRPWFF